MMDKYATDPGTAEEKACDEAYQPKPGTNTPQDQAKCRNCAHFNNPTNTRSALCPFADRVKKP